MSTLRSEMDMSLDFDGFDAMVDTLSDDYLMSLSLQALEDDLNSDENKCRKSLIESDYELAVSLAESDVYFDDYNPKFDSKPDPKDIVSPELETLDPNPNIWHLMKSFDDMFFSGVLSKHCIELRWSSRMTRTAGVCAWNPNNGFCSISLSLPLLQLRCRKDLVETLIHEMIHAFLFVTKEDDNHESHGQVFHEHMYRINRMSGADITVYHNFHDEVRHYLTHVWRCNGVCRERSPYYGYVKRSMNRPPGPRDYWFQFHARSCGGSFVKESEPKNDNKIRSNKTKAKKVLTPESLKNKDIRSYVNLKDSNGSTGSIGVVPFTGKGVKLGSNKNKTNKDLKIDKPITGRTSVPTISSTNSIPKPYPSVFNGKGYVLGKYSAENMSKTNDWKLKTNQLFESKEKAIKLTQNNDNISTDGQTSSISLSSSEESLPSIFSVNTGKGSVLGKSENKAKISAKTQTQTSIITDLSSNKVNENDIEIIEID